MLNVLQPDTKVAVHRHLNTSETAICVEGCIDWVFMKSCRMLMLEGLSMMARRRLMRASLRRWGGSGFVLERGSLGFRFLWGLGIVLRCMNLALFLRLRMGLTVRGSDELLIM